MMAILMCFWTHRAIWVKSIATLELLEPLETLAKRAARSAASKEENDPGKISAKSDNWFKSYGQKVSYQRLGTGIEYPDPEPGNRDLIPVEPGN